MSNWLKRSLGGISENKTNTKTKKSLLSKVTQRVQGAVLAGLISSGAMAKTGIEEVPYQNSFQEGVSFQVDTSDFKNIVGSNFRHMNSRIHINNGNISIDQSPEFTNVFRFVVEQKDGLRTLFEVGKNKKVQVLNNVAPSDAADFIHARKSIKNISDQNQSNFTVHSAEISGDNSTASFTYQGTKVNVSGENVSAKHKISENTEISASAGKNNNTAGIEYTLSDDTKLKATAGDKNTVGVEHQFTQNVSGNVSANEYGAAVGTRFTTDDGKTSLTLSGGESSQANFRTTTPKVFGQEAVINAGITYRNNTIGYNAKLGQIFGDEFVYSLEASKRGEEQLFLIKSTLKVQANFYLTAIYSSLKMAGLEYTYEEFLDENHISDLSFGELKQMYEMTQKTIGFGLSYVSGPNLLSVNYYKSTADNVLFDERINARYDENNKDIIITEKIHAGATGYNSNIIEAENEYRVNDNFTFKGSIGYEMTQLLGMYNRSKEDISNIRYSIGGEYTTDVFSVGNQDMRISTDINYSDSEFSKKLQSKISFDFQDTLLSRNGLYPYISYGRQDIKGVKDNIVGVGIDRRIGNTSRTKNIRDVNEQNHTPAKQFNGDIKRFAQQKTHIGDYFIEKGVAELRKSETVENAHDYVIYLGALKTTGNFVSNIESVEEFIEVRDTQLIFKGINSGAFDALAGKKFILSLELSNGNIYPIDIPTTQGSTNITLGAYKSSDLNGVLRTTEDTFVYENSPLYDQNDIVFIKNNYHNNQISSGLIGNTFEGNIYTQIITLGYIGKLMTLEALEELSNNLDVYNQDDILAILKNGGQIDLDALNATLNQAPTLENISLQTLEDKPLEIQISDIIKSAKDAESPNDKITLAKIAGVDFKGANTPDIELAFGTLKFGENSMKFTPYEETFGTQDFTIQVADEKGALSNVAQVSIDILIVDDVPEIILSDLKLKEDEKLVIPRDQIIADIDTKLEDVDLNVTSLDNKVTFKFLENGNLEVTPLDDVNGEISIQINVSQGDFSDTKVISGTIAPKNDAPEFIGEDEIYTVNELDERKIDLNVKFQDKDIGDILSFVLPEDVNSDIFSIQENILTVKNTGVNKDTLELLDLQVVDTQGASISHTFSFMLSNSKNEPSVGVDDEFTISEDKYGVLDIINNDIDVDGDTISIGEIGPVENATVEILDAKRIRITPNANYYGPISFEYTPVSNGVEGSKATVRGTVISVDDAPEVLKNQKIVELKEGKVNGQKITTFELFDDIDSTFTYSIDSQFADIDEQSGEITLKNVDKQSSGFDIVVTATADGKSVESTIKVQIENVDDATVTNPDSLTIHEDSGEHTADVLANDSDPDNELSIQSIDYDETKVSASIVDNKIQVETLQDINGEFEILYTTNTGATETLTVNINAVNDAPESTGLSSTYTVGEGSSVNIDLNTHFSDVDNQVLGYAVQSGLESGDYSINGNILTVTNPGVTQDVLKNVVIQAVDAGGLTAQKDFAITFSNTANEAPVINNFSPITSINESETKSFTFKIFDANGDNLTATLNNAPEFMTLSREANTVTVNIAPGYEAANTYENISVSISDGQTTTTSQAFNLEVTNVDRPLQAENKTITLTEGAVNGETFNVTNLFNDPDGNTISYELVSNPNADLSGNTLTFKDVGEDFNGKLTFNVVGTSDGVEKTATLTVNVNSVNDAPVATFESFSTDEDTNYNGQLTATDVDGDALSYGIKTSATNGTVNINEDGTFTYTPNANFNGTDTFTYQVSDGELTDTQVVTVTVNAVNDAPVATFTNTSTNEDTPKTGQLTSNDVDGDTVNYSLSTQAENGTVNINEDGTFTYTPNANFNGTDTFTYQVSDGELTDSQVVTVTVNAVNDAPVTVDSTAAVIQNSVNNIITPNATDPDGDTLSYTATVNHGSVNVENGNIVYNPGNYVGPATITYQASDGALSTEGKVDVTVNYPAPQANDIGPIDVFTKSIEIDFNDSVENCEVTKVVSSNPVIQGEEIDTNKYKFEVIEQTSIFEDSDVTYTCTGPDGREVEAKLLLRYMVNNG